MKRMMMQLFRSLVTVIVVGTMAAMIFSLRSEPQTVDGHDLAPHGFLLVEDAK